MSKVQDYCDTIWSGIKDLELSLRDIVGLKFLNKHVGKLIARNLRDKKEILIARNIMIKGMTQVLEKKLPGVMTKKADEYISDDKQGKFFFMD